MNLRTGSLDVRSLATSDYSFDRKVYLSLPDLFCLMFSGEWRSDLSTVLPIRTKRLDIFPRDIQKQVSEAKRMGTLPDLSAIIAGKDPR